MGHTSFAGERGVSSRAVSGENKPFGRIVAGSIPRPRSLSPSEQALITGKDIFRKALPVHREKIYTALGIIITLTAGGFLFWEIGRLLWETIHAGALGRATIQFIFAAIFGFLIYGNLVYQFARWGYMKRLQHHCPATPELLEHFFDEGFTAPSVAILIPSYKEDAAIIRQSMLSSALQNYPNRRVVLLIDDPPFPGNRDDLAALSAARNLAQEIQTMLAAPAARFRAVYDEFVARSTLGEIHSAEESHRLATLHQEVADWFDAQATGYPVRNHADRLFVALTFRQRAQTHRQRADKLIRTATDRESRVSVPALLREYRQLACLFECELTSFERKQYVNLSHAPNKAMNLNSYIGLIGRQFREVACEDGLHLERTDEVEAAFQVPPATFITTLDADSLLAPDYVLRLVHYIQQPEHERVAVVQTPYSAVPNPSGLLERIAGATTDMQYIVHQGFTHHNATFWVGANALLRKAALDDIVTFQEERGFRIAKYIQDSTVIEDTESSVDLVVSGWQLLNYPERLSFSATPPDFGALLIQRCRWANGGLTILPKLLRHLFQGPGWLRKCREGFMRFHYLTSIAGGNLGLLFLLICPMEQRLNIVWLPLTALPYYVLYGRDLLQAGYNLRDCLRVYALNLLLLPVNLSGVLKSIRQMVTGQQSSFKRTPKVAGRTAAPSAYIALEYAIALCCWVCVGVDVFQGWWLHALFAFVNGAIFCYAIAAFIGVDDGLADLLRGVRARHKQFSYEPIFFNLAPVSEET